MWQCSFHREGFFEQNRGEGKPESPLHSALQWSTQRAVERAPERAMKPRVVSKRARNGDVETARSNARPLLHSSPSLKANLLRSSQLIKGTKKIRARCFERAKELSQSHLPE